MHRSFTHTLIAGAALLLAGHVQAGPLSLVPYQPCGPTPFCGTTSIPGFTGQPVPTVPSPTTTQPSQTNPPPQALPAQEEKPPAEEQPVPAEETMESCKVIHALNGVSFKARECAFSKGQASFTAYEVNYSLPSTPVDRFFISTQASVPGQQQIRGSDLTLSADYISAAAWNDSETSLLGQFSTLFGTEDTGVFAFMLNNSLEIESGSWLTLGVSGAKPSSEFLALDGNDQILARSFVAAANPVPEPGSWALAGLALAGVAGLHRRQRVEGAC